MPNLLVRGVGETLVDSLKARAAAHGRSAEAERRSTWPDGILAEYRENIFSFDPDIAQTSTCPPSGHALDKRIAATALSYDLTLVTRNTRDFVGTGVRLLNPCSGSSARNTTAIAGVGQPPTPWPSTTSPAKTTSAPPPASSRPTPG